MEQSVSEIGWFALFFIAIIGSVFTIVGISLLVGRYLGGILFLCFGLIALLLTVPEILRRWGIEAHPDASAIGALMVMVFAGGGLLFLLVGLEAARRNKAPFSVVLCLGLLLLLSALAMVNGLIRLSDVIIGLFPSSPATFLQNAIRLEVWEMPLLFFYLSVTLPFTAYALSRMSGSGYQEQVGDGEFKVEFTGAQWGLGGLFKWVGVIILSVATLYCWSQSIDILFDTSLASAFSWVGPTFKSLDTVSKGVGSLWEILGFFVVIGFLIYYFTLEEENLGCLIAIILGFAAWLWWAISSGFIAKAIDQVKRILELF